VAAVNSFLKLSKQELEAKQHGGVVECSHPHTHPQCFLTSLQLWWDGDLHP